MDADPPDVSSDESQGHLALVGPTLRAIPGFQEGTFLYHVGDGHAYHVFDKSRRRVRLRCRMYKRLRCRATGDAECDGTDFRRSRRQNHNHAPDAHFANIRFVRKRILTRCMGGSAVNRRDIVAQERAGHVRGVRRMVYAGKLRSAIYRATVKGRPPIPVNLSELAAYLALPQYKHLCDTDDGDNVFAGFGGSSVNKTRCVFFMTSRTRKLLERSNEVFSDGTWKVRSAIFTTGQIFSVVACRRYHIVPLVIVLMESRKRACYDVVFNFLGTVAPTFHPNIVHTDFEVAQFSAWRAFAPDAELDGCLFHSAKDIVLYARMLGLTRLMKRDATARSIIRCCCALALLPPQWIYHGLQEIVLWARNEGLFRDLKPFFEYVHDEWVQKADVLSVWLATHRTNNCCESFNRLFHLNVGGNHPNIWNFICGVVKTFNICHGDVEILNDGGNPSRLRKASAVANDLRLRNLGCDWDEGEISTRDFLRRASHCIENVFEVYGGLV